MSVTAEQPLYDLHCYEDMPTDSPKLIVLPLKKRPYQPPPFASIDLVQTHWTPASNSPSPMEDYNDPMEETEEYYFSEDEEDFYTLDTLTDEWIDGMLNFLDQNTELI